MPSYRERLAPAFWIYVSTALVIPAALLVFLPINVDVGIVSAIVLYGAVLIVLYATTPTIIVTSDELIAGRARLPRSVIGEVTAYRRNEAWLQRGRLSDARSWFLLRGWIDPVVKVQLNDPDDPTPFWVISSRHPQEFVAALTSRAVPATDTER